MKRVVVSGHFDNLKSSDVRLLDEASRLGKLHVYLWSDALLKNQTSYTPKFPQEERLFLLEGIKYVSEISVIDELPNLDALPETNLSSETIWVVNQNDDTGQKRNYCRTGNIQYVVVNDRILRTYPALSNSVVQTDPARKKVVVTGSFDWLHSGHFQFFKEASTYGDLYVVVGSDRNICLLKGEGHPLFTQVERRYMVDAVRFVRQTLISTGSGWMDAEPEIYLIKPDYYVVNEDGDKPEKQDFCRAHQIEYLVLKRIPGEGLPRRESTKLRGF
ncbi:MAG: adenylyltransferase/cytidyltransferase family protein [Leptolinea sp.]|jgi:cytidyltransferase-like protein|nr:adenylyltransferase/cytidyltransferase family protein [Leptolinea sp.]